MNCLQRPVRNRQTGIALVASLVIMLILTILGVTVMNMTSLEEKMAFNTQDRYLARYLAESTALLMAVDAQLPSPDDPGVSGSAFSLTGADIPGLQTANGRITYIQQSSFANMPLPNGKATGLSSGSGNSDDNIPYIYQVSVTANTPAGTTAQMKVGYFYMRRSSN